MKPWSNKQTAYRLRAMHAATRSGQLGASLLEAISYLGVAALVVIGAIALLSSAFSSASSNSLSQQVSAIQSGVKKLYMGQGATYANLSNTVLVSAGVVPATLTSASGGTITNSWNGAVTVAPATSSNEFTIEYKSVPQAVCVAAVTAGGTWSAISINGTAQAMPVTPDAAATACSSGDTNDIIWTST